MVSIALLILDAAFSGVRKLSDASSEMKIMLTGCAFAAVTFSPSTWG